jgi:outer membrane protein assembly factor BamB
MALSISKRLLLAAAIGVAPAIAPAQWLQVGYDAASTYANTAETAITPDNVSLLKLSYRERLGNGSTFGPATGQGGLTFACTSASSVQARSAATGELVWEQTEFGGTCGAPVLDASTVYVSLSHVAAQAERSGGLMAIDQATGLIKWRVVWPSGGGNFCSVGATRDPVLADGVLFVADVVSGVRAINASNGSELWNTQTGDNYLNWGVVASAGQVFVTTGINCSSGDTDESAAIFAFAATTGQLLWTRDHVSADGRNIDWPPMVLGNRIYVMGDYGNLASYRVSDGKLLWSLGPILPKTVLAGEGNMLFLADYDEIRAINAATGEIVWSFLHQSNFWTRAMHLAWANDVLFSIARVDDRKVVMRAHNAQTGQLLIERPMKIKDADFAAVSGLSVVDGRVSVLSSDESRRSGDRRVNARQWTFALPAAPD